MLYDILRIEKDITGKTRVWVDMGNGEVQIFKFDKVPTKAIIKNMVDSLKNSIMADKAKEIELIESQISDLVSKKSIIEKEIQGIDLLKDK
jgi:hypothetical protein